MTDYNPASQSPDDFDEEPLSPIRPQADSTAEDRLMPSIPKPSLPTKRATSDLTATEAIDSTQGPVDKAVEALDRLRQKMAAVAQEHDEGKINRAQFDAIYQRYQEQRQITERLVERDPETGAWQSVIVPGHTGFLREKYEAKVESYAIYHLNKQEQIVRTGHIQIPDQQVLPIVHRLNKVAQRNAKPRAANRILEDERWVLFIPGKYTLAVVIFSLEPSIIQIEHVQDVQNDFERANNQLLQIENYDLRQMVFPHRALFEL